DLHDPLANVLALVIDSVIRAGLASGLRLLGGGNRGDDVRPRGLCKLDGILADSAGASRYQQVGALGELGQGDRVNSCHRRNSKTSAGLKTDTVGEFYALRRWPSVQ